MNAANKYKDVNQGLYRLKDYRSISSLRCRSLKSISQVIQSATIVIAYLIKYKGMGFSQALKFLKTKRAQVCPNLGFQLQLKNYQALNNYSQNVLRRKSLRKSENLPGIAKPASFNITAYNKVFWPEIQANRRSNQSISTKNKNILTK